MFDRLLQNNTVVKIIASFLAILLWLVVHSGEEPLSTGGIAQSSQLLSDKAVTVLYDERNVSLVGEPKVNITLRGSAFDVLAAVANGSSIQLIVDAWNLGEGVHELPVIPRNLPSGVMMDDVRVTVRLEANINRELPISLVTEGQPREGFSAGESLINPKTVIVSGAKSAANTVDRVVATVSLEDQADTIHTTVPIIPVDKAGKPVKNVRLSVERAEVSVPIAKPSKSVSLRLQFKGDLAPGYAVDSVLQPPGVTIYGTAKALDALENYPAPVIDLSGLTRTTKFPLHLAPVEGITSVQPEDVEVEVRVAEAVERTFTGVPLKVTGLKQGEGYQLLAINDKVDVTVSGAPKMIDKMTADDLNLVLDLSNQPTGRHVVRIQANTPNFTKAVRITPESMNVDVKK